MRVFLVAVLPLVFAGNNGSFVEVGTVGEHVSRNQENVLIPCQSNVCVPSGSASFDYCRKVCNKETGQTDCENNCACNGNTPGYMCAGICNKAKTANECGSPVYQICAGEDLICDRTTLATAAPATTAPATNSPNTTHPSTTAPVVTTSAPSTTAPATTAPATGAPNTTEPRTNAPNTTTPSTTAPATTAPVTTVPSTLSPNTTATPNTTAPSTQAPGSQRVQIVQPQRPQDYHLTEYYSGLYLGTAVNNANEEFAWDPATGTLRSASANACLDAFVATDQKLYVHTFTCDPNNVNQKWTYDTTTHQLRHQNHKDMCLSADPTNLEHLAQMVSCSTSDANQYFELRQV
ncbi:hypothetical protein THRCLA_22098 [Thraustotheca clavata]|uniref:Ricin B lectin domain-containing protein n=1 Tax=Thraustotheca clavata TaxID=74557 RepID=A0A1V9ZCR2_9STRA|nr:hypothetical protein THRCLA_22098 [Thraustotheca clavata]